MRFDKINYWSEFKLDIVRKYAEAYSDLIHRKTRLRTAYIDGFAGPGVHKLRSSGAFVRGSPLNALAVEPPFDDYFFIDLDGGKVEQLRSFPEVAGKPHIRVIEGDCNEKLMKEVFPLVRYEDYRRGLCVLDPYGLHLNWEVIAEAGRMGSIDLFLNFPTMDMNRNVLWRNQRSSPEDRARMTAFWGDESWMDVAFTPSPQGDLFGAEEVVKAPNLHVAQAFARRMQEVAGFKEVAPPLAMRNSSNAVVYYLMFASQKEVARKIATDVMKKYENRQGR